MARGSPSSLLIVILATVDLPAYGQAGGPTNNADLVIRHAHVITLDAGSHIVQAVAIRGDRIEAVGTDDEIQPLVGPGTKIIDAGGKVSCPGSTTATCTLWRGSQRGGSSHSCFRVARRRDELHQSIAIRSPAPTTGLPAPA